MIAPPRKSESDSGEIESDSNEIESDSNKIDSDYAKPSAGNDSFLILGK